MKTLLLDVNVTEKDGVQTCWVVLSKLAFFKKTDPNKLFHFNVKSDSKTPMIMQHGVSRNENEALFLKLSNSLPGALVSLELGANEYGSPCIKDISVLESSPYSLDTLYR